MELLNQWFKYGKNLLGYLEGCLFSSFNNPTCAPFWTAVAFTSIALSVLLMAWSMSKIYKYLMAVKAERKRQEDAARIADEETMEKYRWRGED